MSLLWGPGGVVSYERGTPVGRKELCIAVRHSQGHLFPLGREQPDCGDRVTFNKDTHGPRVLRQAFVSGPLVASVTVRVLDSEKPLYLSGL